MPILAAFMILKKRKRDRERTVDANQQQLEKV
jgi:hypothetical protein